MKFEGIGMIGSGNMAPTESMTIRNGESKPFRRFSMFCQDRRKAPKKGDNDRTYPASEPVQVILPDGTRGEKLFPWLHSGRRVLIKGDLTFNPQVSKKEGEEDRVYPNATVYMDELTFLDAPKATQARRLLEDMRKCELVTEQQQETHLAALTAYYKADSEPSVSSTDPDQPDFHPTDS